jgi:hypothetical protein
MLWMILSCPARNLGFHHGNRFSEYFRPLAGIKYAQSAIELRAKRRANHLYPLRDGSEKDEGFPRGARETMVARYKRRQLGVSGWNPERKALGFFGHVAWQASGSLETAVGRPANSALRWAIRFGLRPSRLSQPIIQTTPRHPSGSVCG